MAIAAGAKASHRQPAIPNGVLGSMRWTRSFGQFGGLAKVDSGLSHAASLMS